MQNVQTLMVALNVTVVKDMLEMVYNVPVSLCYLYICFPKSSVYYYDTMTNISSHFHSPNLKERVCRAGYTLNEDRCVGMSMEI